MSKPEHFIIRWDRAALKRAIDRVEAAVLFALKIESQQDVERSQALKGAVFEILMRAGDDRQWALEQIDVMLALHGLRRISG